MAISLEYTLMREESVIRVSCNHGWDPVSLITKEPEPGDLPIRTDTIVDCRREKTLRSTDGNREIHIFRGRCEDCGRDYIVKGHYSREDSGTSAV